MAVWLLPLVLLLSPLVSSSLVCGPDVTDWFARQLDLGRAQADANWATTDTFDGLLGLAGLAGVDSAASQLSQILASQAGICGAETGCNGTVTVCDTCFKLDSLGRILYGYCASTVSSTAIWGAVYADGILSAKDIDEVLIGFYLRGKAPAGPLQSSVPRMCQLLNGERGNMLLGMLFSGMSGDVIAQDALYSVSNGVPQLLPQWETETGQNFSVLIEDSLADLEIHTMGTWLSLVGTDCTPCSTSGSWSDISFAPASNRATVFARLQRKISRLRIATAENSTVVGCSQFSRDSPEWASCSRWNFVVASSSLAGVAETKKMEFTYSSIVRGHHDPSAECQAATVPLAVQIFTMLDAPDCCDPGLQQEFRILVDDAVTACAYTSFADILRPLLSFSQVICNAAPLDTGETGEECMRELLVKFAAQPNFELMSVPLCIPCASDILTREKMDLAFDLMCSLQPNYWPDDPEVQACSCLGIYNESLGNTSVVPIPSDCLIPLTGAKTPLAGTTAYVPSHCDSNIGTMNSVLLCCSRLLDDMLGMMDMQTGVSGMRSSMCISQKWHLRMRLGHFNYAKAQQRASKEAIIQMAFDEVAHRIPAIDRDEFLQNVTLTQSDQTTDSSNITLMDVTYEPMSELGLNASTMDFETGDVLLEMTDYLLADDGNITIETVDMVLEGGESSELSVSDSAVVVPLISAFLVVGAVALLL